jgi:transposase
MQIHGYEFAAAIGLDWADRKHDVCLFDPDAEKYEYAVLEHDPKALASWVERLRIRFGGRQIAVTLELERGPIVSALLEHDLFVLFPIRPSALASYRNTLRPSGAKDDPTDAFLAVDFLRRHPDQCGPLRPERPEMRALQRMVADRRSLVQDRTRILNRLTNTLKAYFPQVLDWFDDKNTAVFADFLARWPSLQAVKRARRESLVKFFHEHNVRRADVIERRVAAVADSVPLTRDRGVIGPSELMVEALVPQLRAVSVAIQRFEEEIHHLCARLPDFAVFDSLPGAGATLAPRLLAAFGERRERFPTAASVQKWVGVAPVTERSGKQHWVHWRFICNKFLRQTFVEWAGETIPHSFWARTFYERHRAKGASHNAALRALAFKWIRIVWRCWIDRVPYDESRYLTALQRRGSSLLSFAAKAPH